MASTEARQWLGYSLVWQRRPAYRMTHVDALFAERRLAEVYDPLDPDRSDLDAYAAMVDEFGARSVIPWS